MVARRRHQQIQHPLLGGALGAGAHLAHLGFTRLLDGDVGQIADDGVHVLADIADLGELGRLDLDEGRIGQARQTAGNLGLADAGGANHQDVLGRDFLAQRAFHLLTAPAVAQRNRDSALGVGLADDVFVEFGNDFLRGHVGHAQSRLSTV